MLLEESRHDRSNLIDHPHQHNKKERVVMAMDSDSTYRWFMPFILAIMLTITHFRLTITLSLEGGCDCSSCRYVRISC